MRGTKAASIDDLSINKLPQLCSSHCMVQHMPGSLLSAYTTARDCNLFPPQNGEENTDSLQHCKHLQKPSRDCAQDPKAVGEKAKA